MSKFLKFRLEDGHGIAINKNNISKVLYTSYKAEIFLNDGTTIKDVIFSEKYDTQICY